MKLDVFYATDGDCLLLTSGDGHRVLVDGGRTESFATLTEPVLSGFAKHDEAIDLVVVSHIDADHIIGILRLLEAMSAWTSFDFRGSGPEPRLPRPPRIDGLWHNAWRDLVGTDLSGPIEALATEIADSVELAGFDTDHAAAAVSALADIAESIPQGAELLRIVDDGTPITRNAPFRHMVLLQRKPHVEKVGMMSLTVLGPARKHLERLREEWRTFLAAKMRGTRRTGTSLDLSSLPASSDSARDLLASIATNAEVITDSDPSSVTPPNRASIVLLAEEAGRTCLLTGDAAEEEIVDGLRAARLFGQKPFHCNVVKVQHHGSEHNLSVAFGRSVLAEHYVFSANGASGNPNPSVVKTIVETRRDADPTPFTLWFNCSPTRPDTVKQRSIMKAAIAEATAGAERDPNIITVRVLDDAEPFFSINV